MSPKVEEDLIAENQRLRAKVAYLKNLQALVLEDERKCAKNAGNSRDEASLPNGKYRIELFAGLVVDGSYESVRLDFKGERDFQNYIQSLKKNRYLNPMHL